jgi:hypothetical protein
MLGLKKIAVDNAREGLQIGGTLFGKGEVGELGVIRRCMSLTTVSPLKAVEVNAKSVS